MRPTVALVRCTDYDEDRVETSVAEAVALLGGMGRFVSPGERVFIKVNLVMPKKAEYAVTTHPAVVKAVVKQVQAAGGTAIIGDSPGGPFTASVLKLAYRLSGMEKVAEETGAALSFDVREVELPHPEGKLLKRITVSKALADADAIITIPKLKTHGLTALTGAVKILFGAVPGLKKAEYHLKMPKIEDFSDMLVDILTLVKPRLTVMDGIVGMEGDGPTAGSPRGIGAVLASADSVACDVAGALIGLEPERVTTTRAAMARRMTSGRLSDIELLGAPLAEVRLDDFKQAVIKGTTSYQLSRPVARLAERFLRPKPRLRPELCTGCGTCARVCPPKAIRLVEKRPRTDYSKCIRCFCCQELCPQSAVAIWRPRLAKYLLR